jgi:hypothetical protein
MQHTRRLVVVVFALVLEIHLIFYLCYFVSKRGGFHSIAYWHAKSFSGVVGIVAMPLGKSMRCDAMRCTSNPWAIHNSIIIGAFLLVCVFGSALLLLLLSVSFPRETSISKQSIHEFDMVAAFSKY